MCMSRSSSSSSLHASAVRMLLKLFAHSHQVTNTNSNHVCPPTSSILPCTVQMGHMVRTSHTHTHTHEHISQMHIENENTLAEPRHFVTYTWHSPTPPMVAKLYVTLTYGTGVRSATNPLRNGAISWRRQFCITKLRDDLFWEFRALCSDDFSWAN